MNTVLFHFRNTNTGVFLFQRHFFLALITKLLHFLQANVDNLQCKPDV